MEIVELSKSDFPHGTILRVHHPESPTTIHQVAVDLGEAAVTGFVHGADKAVVSLMPDAGLWIADCNALIPPHEILAGFDTDVPLGLFLGLYADSLKHTKAVSHKDSPVLRIVKRGGAGRQSHWSFAHIINLNQRSRDDESGKPLTLRDLVSQCATSISRAIGSKAEHICFELYPREKKLIVGDDGDPKSLYRQDREALDRFRGYGATAAYRRFSPHTQPPGKA